MHTEMTARYSAEQNPRNTDSDTLDFQFLTKVNAHADSQREHKD